MTSLFSLQIHPLLFPPFPDRARAPKPLSHRTQFGFCTKSPSFPLRRESVVVRLIPNGELPDIESIEGLAQELFGRAEGIIYTLADAAASSPDAVTEGSKRTGDWLSGITGYLETVLKVLKDGLSALHVPYAYGFAIILLTVLVKAVTFPLTKKQVESSLAMRSLQPQVKAIQQRYAGDPERIQLETARLYKLAGVNPLAGCLPTLATIPVWIGLYRALSNVADEGLLSEGFFWIPSLAGPSRQSGSGTSWLFPFIDGHPPLGWSDTLAYLVLPVLLVVSQYISVQIMQPSQGSDPSQKSSQAVTKLLPLMIGYFALAVPSGLSLYWFTNNILSTAQQVWLQKLGGAKNPVNQYSDRKTREEPSTIQNSVSNIEKSVLDIETEKEKSSQGENADSGGLLPGERFKQLKEQEARRRKQREEEEKRREEAAASSRIITEHRNMEVELVERKNEQVNGQQGSEKSQTKLNMPATNNGGINCNAGAIVKDEESPNEDIHKEELSETHAPTGNQSSTHDARDRRDQETERGEV